MQSFRVNTVWKRRAPARVALIGGAILLPWNLEVQTQAPAGAQAQPKPQMPVQSAEPEQVAEFYRIITIGNYRLKIADANSIWDATATPEQKARLRADRLRAKEQTASGAGDHKASVSSNYALGTDGEAIHPNTNLTLDITGRNQEEALLIQGVCGVHGKDDHGRTLPTQMDPFPADPIFFSRPVQVDHRKIRIALQTEADAKSLKTLEGEFVVVNGVVRTLEFAPDELKDGTSKRLDQITATLNYIQPRNRGCEVSVTCVSSQFQPRDPFGMQENAEQFLLGRRSIQAEIVGTDGITYISSGGGGGAHSDRPLTIGADGVARRDGKVPSISTVTSHLSFLFSAIPEGVRPQKVILRVVLQQGENFRVPFKFTDIPLDNPL